MSMPQEKLEFEAMQLSATERGLLLRKLAISLDGGPSDSPEAVAKAWNEESDRRLDKKWIVAKPCGYPVTKR